MTAICKTILIHGDNLQDLFDYGADPDKTSVSQNGLQSALDYAANPLKTLAGLDDGDQDLLVSGILCQPESAALDFGITREMYLANNGMERYASFAYPDPKTDSIRDISKKPVTAVHLIQSFGEPCLDPRVVHHTCTTVWSTTQEIENIDLSPEKGTFLMFYIWNNNHEHF